MTACGDVRARLQPWLDDELDVATNLTVTEHLSFCPPCAALAETERRVWDAVAGRLRAETCPAGVRDAFASAMRRESRAERARRTLVVLVPLAAAAALAVAVLPYATSTGRGDLQSQGALAPAPPPRLRFASRYKIPPVCDRDGHGKWVEWAADRYDALARPLADDAALDAASLARAGTSGRRILAPDDLRREVRARLGREYELPAAITKGGTLLGGEILDFRGAQVVESLVRFPDRELAVYEIAADDADLGHLSSFGPDGRPARCAGCPHCDVAVAVRAGRASLVISRQSRDWDEPGTWLQDRALGF